MYRLDNLLHLVSKCIVQLGIYSLMCGFDSPIEWDSYFNFNDQIKWAHSNIYNSLGVIHVVPYLHPYLEALTVPPQHYLSSLSIVIQMLKIISRGKGVVKLFIHLRQGISPCYWSHLLWPLIRETTAAALPWCLEDPWPVFHGQCFINMLLIEEHQKVTRCATIIIFLRHRTWWVIILGGAIYAHQCP